MRHDSKEHLHLPVITEQDISDIAVEVAVFPAGTEPTVWAPAVHETGGLRVLIGEGTTLALVEQAWHRVRVRFPDSPENVVLDAPSIFIT